MSVRPEAEWRPETPSPPPSGRATPLSGSVQSDQRVRRGSSTFQQGGSRAERLFSSPPEVRRVLPPKVEVVLASSLLPVVMVERASKAAPQIEETWLILSA